MGWSASDSDFFIINFMETRFEELPLDAWLGKRDVALDVLFEAK